MNAENPTQSQSSIFDSYNCSECFNTGTIFPWGERLFCSCDSGRVARNHLIKKFLLDEVRALPLDDMVRYAVALGNWPLPQNVEVAKPVYDAFLAWCLAIDATEPYRFRHWVNWHWAWRKFCADEGLNER